MHVTPNPTSEPLESSKRPRKIPLSTSFRPALAPNNDSTTFRPTEALNSIKPPQRSSNRHRPHPVRQNTTDNLHHNHRHHSHPHRQHRQRKKGVNVTTAYASAPSSALRARVVNDTVVVSPKRQSSAGAARYAVFVCRWARCRARLHNLDTLRKHVWRVHAKQSGNGGSDSSGGGGGGSDDGVVKCRWEGCEKVISVRDPRTGRVNSRSQLHSFGNVEAWASHVELLHISPVSWVQGDGPPGGLMGESSLSEAYLYDAQGRQITPHVDVPQQHQNMGSVMARSIMTNAAMKPNRRAKLEAMEKRAMKSADKRLKDADDDDGFVIRILDDTNQV